MISVRVEETCCTGLVAGSWSIVWDRRPACPARTRSRSSQVLASIDQDRLDACPTWSFLALCSCQNADVCQVTIPFCVIQPVSNYELIGNCEPNVVWVNR